MTVPHHDPHKQLPNTALPPDVELTFPANDDAPVPPVLTPGTASCPTCGRPYDLFDLKAAIEEVFP
jgi:hypothetical protein